MGVGGPLRIRTAAAGENAQARDMRTGEGGGEGGGRALRVEVVWCFVAVVPVLAERPRYDGNNGVRTPRT